MKTDDSTRNQLDGSARRPVVGEYPTDSQLSVL